MDLCGNYLAADYLLNHMNNLVLYEKTDIKKQNSFIMDTYPNFIYLAIHGYLFEGLDLREIEHKYLGEDCQGFFSKNVLNMLGIDTSKKAKNKGKYCGMDPKLIGKMMIEDKDPMINNIGRIILSK